MPASTSVIRKGPTLEAIDQASEGKTVTEMQAILTALRQTGVDLVTFAESHSNIKKSDRDHLANHWFSGPKSYWPDGPNVASTFLDGLDKALTLSIQNAKDSRALPLDSYWLVSGDAFRVVAMASAQQVTMLVITPVPKPPDEPGILISE
jgi:hypothetical protein